MVYLQGLLVLIVDTLTKYYNIIERVYFIRSLFILFISTFSFFLFLYTVSCGIREITSIPAWTYRFLLCSILLTRWRRSRLEHDSPSPLFVAMPLYKNMFLYETTHRDLRNNYQSFDSLETNDHKFRGNCTLQIKAWRVKLHMKSEVLLEDLWKFLTLSFLVSVLSLNNFLISLTKY